MDAVGMSSESMNQETIVWLLWSGNRHASSRGYWGWVSLRTAIAALLAIKVVAMLW